MSGEEKRDERVPASPSDCALCHGHPGEASWVATWCAFISGTGESQCSPGRGAGQNRAALSEMEPEAERDAGWGSQEQGESKSAQSLTSSPCQETTHEGDL